MRVLVVEDDADTSEALCELLRAEGYEADAAPNGLAALQRLRADGSVALVLLDLMMPVMSGWEFREEQLRDGALARIPVILLTADDHAAQRCEQLGAAGWLQKPIRPRALLETLARHGARG